MTRLRSRRQSPGSPVPWKRVQGYRIDLDRVELVYQQPGDDRSVAVTLISGAAVNLSGDDAAQFLRAFDEYRAVQPIREEPGPEAHVLARTPKGPVLGPRTAHYGPAEPEPGEGPVQQGGPPPAASERPGKRPAEAREKGRPAGTLQPIE